MNTLVGWWKGEDNTVDSVNGNDAIWRQFAGGEVPAIPAYETGAINRCFDLCSSLNYETDYTQGLEIPYISEYSVLSSGYFTFDMWVRLDYNVRFLFKSSGQSFQLELMGLDSISIFNDSDSIDFTPSFSAHTFYHIRLVCAAWYWSVFVDDVNIDAEGSNYLPIAWLEEPFQIFHTYLEDGLSRVRIDEIKIYDDSEPTTTTAAPGTPWFPVESERDWTSIAMSSDGVKQAALAEGGFIYESVDSGNTWTPAGDEREWRSIAMSADGAIQTAVVDNDFIYRSLDSGATWSPVATERRWRAIQMSADGLVQVALTRDEEAVYKSIDSGATWNPIAIDTHDGEFGINSLAMSANGVIQTVATLYETFNLTNGHIYISNDSGDTWTRIEEAYLYWKAVAMSADGAKQIAVTSSKVYQSVDYGLTWTLKEGLFGGIDVAMSSDGNIRAIVKHDGQIYVSIDGGNTWDVEESERGWAGIAVSSDEMKMTAIVDAEGKIYIRSPTTTTPKIVLADISSGIKTKLIFRNFMITTKNDIEISANENVNIKCYGYTLISDNLKLYTQD
jgi:photosystem II stability/assembly factor-like uncharacterized protein